MRIGLFTWREHLVRYREQNCLSVKMVSREETEERTAQSPHHPTRMPKIAKRNPVAKAVRALNWLMQTPEEEVGVRQMAAALSLTPSNAHQVLNALLAERLVHQDKSTGRYSLGLETLRWANLIVDRTPLRAIALPEMRRLVQTCNETVFLGIYDYGRREMMFAANIESMHQLRYVIALNRWFPITAGASALAILAFLPADDIDSILAEDPLPALTQNTITDPRKLKRELALIRKQGYAVSRGQREPGAVGLGAPIFDHESRVVGDLVVTIPEQRFKKASLKPLSEKLRHHASEVTRGIGGKVPSSL
jgi:DNA-binding IclR family transcriptional regulator